MWRALSSVKGSLTPAPRSSHGVSVVGRKVFIFSGEKEPRVAVDNDMHCYDLDLEEWVKVSVKGTSPIGRVGHAQAAIGSKVYVFGGRTGVAMGEGLLAELHCFDTKTSTWTTVQDKGEKPCARSYHAMVADDKRLYLFGGCTKDRLNDLYTFDPVTSEWARLPGFDAITPRGGPGLAVVGSKIYVIAGFTGKEVDDMYSFCTESNTWQALHPSPNIPPISVFGTATVGSKILLFGGEVKPSNAGHAGAGAFSNDVYLYNTERPDQGWRKLDTGPDRPSARGWLPAATTPQGQVVIFGGLSPQNDRLQDLWVLTP